MAWEMHDVGGSGLGDVIEFICRIILNKGPEKESWF
jgi:hypothetical protein